MGQDPRGLPYMRIAKERGIGDNDIANIPIYILDENGPARVQDYNSLHRYSLGINHYNLGVKRYFTKPVVDGVEEQEKTPKPQSFIKASCNPNPFNSSTTIHFELSHTGKVDISIYTISGQRVRIYNLGECERGAHTVPFDASGLAAGQYLYRINAGYAYFSGKMLLLK